MEEHSKVPARSVFVQVMLAVQNNLFRTNGRLLSTATEKGNDTLPLFSMSLKENAFTYIW